MNIEAKETFPDFVRHIKKELKIEGSYSSRKKAGVAEATIKVWLYQGSLPNIRTLLNFVKAISQQTGDTPQDVLDMVMESIPEWRKMNKGE